MGKDKAGITVIGTGNMGGAFSEALSCNTAIELSIYDSYRPCADKIAEGKPIRVLDSMAQAKGSDVIIIAVKPQVLPEIYQDLSELNPRFFISIAAGVTLEKLKKNLRANSITIISILVASRKN